MGFRISVVVLAFFVTVAWAQEKGTELLGVGDEAPELRLEKVLQAPPDTSVKIEDLRGKVVILQFWAPQGRESVQALTHMSKLGASFKGKPVQFISIAAIDESTFKAFAAAMPISGWVGLDKDLWTFSDYSAGPVPHTVVIDQQGHVAAITKAENVTEAAINDLLAGKAIDLPPKKGKAIQPQWKPGQEKDETEPLLQLVISPSNADPRAFHMSISKDGRRILVNAAPLPYLLGLTYGVRPCRVVWIGLPPETRYKVSVVAPSGDKNAAAKLLQDALERTFGLRPMWQIRMTPCYVLRRIEDRPLALSPVSAERKGKGGATSLPADGDFTSFRGTAAQFVQVLENFLPRPVIDETALEGQYNFHVEVGRGSIDDLNPALGKVGLELKQEERRIKLLVVDRATGDDPS